MTGPASRSQTCSPFEVYDDRLVQLLIERFPLAWVCAAGGEEASLLPLVGVFNSEDRLVELIGHFARSNPLGAAFSNQPKAMILFNGPSGYISPAQAERRDWAPTWNYAQARVQAEVFVEPEFTAEAVNVLIEKMEQGTKNPWSASELGARYKLLLPHIVGFRARVTNIKAKFKMGQDEHPATLDAILGNIKNKELEWWMRHLNLDRLKEG